MHNPEIVGVIVQARNSSTRYPKKMLHKFNGDTAIEWVLKRCLNIKSEYKILATSQNEEDDAIADIATKKGWEVVRGSVEDVLSRYEKAVREYNLDVAVRVTGDCVLLDSNIVNYALSKFQEVETDYLYIKNIIDGFNSEIVSGKAILEAAEKATLPSEREHVCPYIVKTEQFKKIYTDYGAGDLSNIHLSLDYREDALVIEQIIKRFDDSNFVYQDVVNLIKKEPKILEKSKHIKPQEGYLKSLEQDKDFLSRRN